MPTYFPVRLRGDGPTRISELCGTDFNPGGLFILMREPPPPGSLLRLEFDLAPQAGLVTADAKVIRTVTAEDESDESRWGAEVLFTELADDDQRRIQDWVRRLGGFEPEEPIPMPGTPAAEPSAHGDPVSALDGARREAEGWGQMEVRVRLEGFQYLTRHHQVKMTPEGLFIRTEAPLPTGSRVSLEIQAHGDDRVYRAKGQVMRLVATRVLSKTTATPGMSIRITGCDEATRTFLKSLMPKAADSSL